MSYCNTFPDSSHAIAPCFIDILRSMIRVIYKMIGKKQITKSFLSLDIKLLYLNYFTHKIYI